MTLEELRTRCHVDRVTRCWHWQGSKAIDGTPRVWALDLRRLEKRSMSGPAAVWQIAHREAPPEGWLVYRCCGVGDCLQPAHLRLVASKKALGRLVAQSGRWKGTHVEARRANAAKGQAAQGIVPTPDDVVRAIRTAPAIVTTVELGALFGVTPQTVSQIRRRVSRSRVED